jgi:hypothetical protein
MSAARDEAHVRAATGAQRAEVPAKSPDPSTAIRIRRQD